MPRNFQVKDYFHPNTELSPFVDVTGFIIVLCEPACDVWEPESSGENQIQEALTALFKVKPCFSSLNFDIEKLTPEKFFFRHRHTIAPDTEDGPSYTSSNGVDDEDDNLTYLRINIRGRIFDEYLEYLDLGFINTHFFTWPTDSFDVRNMEIFGVDMLGRVEHVGGSHAEYLRFSAQQLSCKSFESLEYEARSFAESWLDDYEQFLEDRHLAEDSSEDDVSTDLND